MKNVKQSALTVAISEAMEAENAVELASGKATEKARAVATLLVKDYKLASVATGKLAESLNAALANAVDTAISQGVKVDITTSAYRNFKSHVSDFAVCFARPETPVEVVKRDKNKTKVMTTAKTAAEKSIAEARTAAKAIREGEGASGNNKTGANGQKPAPAPVVSAISKPMASFADIQPKLEAMLADKDQRAILAAFLRSHGYDLVEVKATKPAAKAKAKAEPKAKPGSTVATLTAAAA